MMEARRDELTAEVTADDAPAPPPPAPEMDLVAKAEAIAKAREAGWTETTAFDYESFNRPAADGEYDGQAQAYEWKDEYGDIGPEVPALERILFGNEFQLREGRHRGAIDSFEVIVEGPVKPQPIGRFEDAGLHPVLLRNVQLCHYTVPTPIQAYTIPALQLGYDVVGCSQTGSGKTAAYLIPILSKLMGKADKLAGPRSETIGRPVRAEPLVVIVVPTRELAIQIYDEARRMCYRSKMRPRVAYGGLPMKICRDQLEQGCDVLIGTPGRLVDLMNQPQLLTMSRVKFTVIDEADEMLNNDWEEQLKKIMGGGDTNEDADHCYMMFSATFPKSAREMAREYMALDYMRIRVGRAGQAHENITQEVIEVTRQNKKQATYDVLFASKPARTLIFCNSKHEVDLLDDYLYNQGLPTTSIHGERDQREREDAIRSFRTGKAPILIATGVSARGLDIAGIAHVINYDLPRADHGGIQEYIHRIGRTARIGNRGTATSFYNDRDEGIAQDLVNILIECKQTVPAFLEHLKPEEGDTINFNDESDDEDADGGAGIDVDAAWGASDNGEAAPTEDTTMGFTPDAGSGAAAAAASDW